MCKAIQELIEEGKREAEEKAAIAEKRALAAETTASERIALNFLRKGSTSMEEIAENTGLAFARVEELAKTLA